MFSIHPFSDLTGPLKKELLSPYWNHKQGYEPVLEELKKLDCRTVILEHDYIDADFVKDFGSFFSRFFRPHQRSCKRLHFFRLVPNRFERDFLHRDIAREEVQEAYLGYMVIRPTATYQIGRTALPFPSENGCHLTCCENLRANLLGTDLTVRGMPYLQQDAQTGACAQAAIWMASHYMKSHFDYRVAALSDITSRATATSLALGEPTPAMGLTAEQMIWGLKSLGYSPLLIRASTIRARNVRRIYSYIESEIPVILLVRNSVGGHALTVIGHDRDVVPPHLQCGAPHNSSDAVSRFIYHDDAVGPYRSLWIDDAKNASWKLSDLEYILVPLPRSIFVRSDEAFEISKKFLDDPMFAADRKKLPADLTLRMFLMPSNDFKKTVVAQMKAGTIHPAVAKAYLTKNLPRFIWITEIYAADDIQKVTAKSPSVIGEIILDPSEDKLIPGFLAIHYPGSLILREPGRDDPILDHTKPMNRHQLQDDMKHPTFSWRG